jgi:ketosteroid isomerase-like protein
VEGDEADEEAAEETVDKLCAQTVQRYCDTAIALAALRETVISTARAFFSSLRVECVCLSRVWRESEVNQMRPLVS